MGSGVYSGIGEVSVKMDEEAASGFCSLGRNLHAVLLKKALLVHLPGAQGPGQLDGC